THENVNVNYDPGSHLLVCPAHGAIFDPANGGKVIQGPATRPVASVKLRVNADGSVSTV
ncbi:MAG: Rieske 2Fe-2S domain-containing protein, partial [Ktedonobacteraceae bacterium]|nr:Rieske 2Fe-2S domain-containing protein [Ktedonobacteraceae bacterium]